jgi:hypothetical protein
VPKLCSRCCKQDASPAHTHTHARITERIPHLVLLLSLPCRTSTQDAAAARDPLKRHADARALCMQLKPCAILGYWYTSRCIHTHAHTHTLTLPEPLSTPDSTCRGAFQHAIKACPCANRACHARMHARRVALQEPSLLALRAMARRPPWVNQPQLGEREKQRRHQDSTRQQSPTQTNIQHRPHSGRSAAAKRFSTPWSRTRLAL